MAQIQVTISYKFLERLAYWIIIAVLLFMLISNYVSDDSGSKSVEKTEDVSTKTMDEPNEVETQEETEPEPEPETEIEEEPEPEPEPEPNVPSEPSLSGEVKADLGKINFEIQEDGRAKIIDVTISVENGLDEDVLLFADIYLTESGNDELELGNPYWNQVPMPEIKSGETKLVKIDSSKSWPIGVTDGDKLIVDAEFKDFGGDVIAEDSSSVTV